MKTPQEIINIMMKNDSFSHWLGVKIDKIDVGICHFWINCWALMFLVNCCVIVICPPPAPYLIFIVSREINWLLCLFFSPSLPPWWIATLHNISSVTLLLFICFFIPFTVTQCLLQTGSTKIGWLFHFSFMPILCQ